MYIITYGVLLKTHEFLYETRERCGYLNIIMDVNKDGNSEVLIDTDEQEPLSKNNCKTKESNSYKWHTHGFLSKAYPSEQDIVSVLVSRTDKKYKKPPELTDIVEIIFTMWGIWEIVSKNKLKVTKP